MAADGGATPLVARDAEIRRLRSVVDGAIDGAGQIAVIEGEPGIGKSRLLDEALSYASTRGFSVFRAAGAELERERAFHVFSKALGINHESQDPKRAEIGRLLVGDLVPATSLIQTRPLDLGFRIVDSITALVEERSATAPVALALEDLQWADSGSLRTVHALAHSVAALPVSLFLTLRPYPVVPELDRLVEGLLAQDAVHLPLSPVTREETERLAAAMLGARLGPRLREQVVGTGGNPLFVIELVGALRDEGRITFRDDIAEVGEISLPRSLRLTVLRRLATLLEETQQLLKIASVLGTSFAARDLSIVTGRAVIEFLAAITEATRAGFLRDEEGYLTFRHDVIREAIYEDIPLPIRKELHRHAGIALGAAGVPPIGVAGHLSLGASVGDVEAVEWLHRAALDIAPRSAPVAVELLERARELTNETSAERNQITTDLARSLFVVGRLRDAERLAREALATEQDPLARVELGRIMSMVLFYLGDRPAGRAHLDDRALAPEAPEHERAIDLAFAALASPFVGDLEGARKRAEQAAKLGERLRNELAVSVSVVALAFVARYRGSVEEALALARRGVELAARPSWDPWAAIAVDPEWVLGAACLEADRLDEAEERFRSGRRSKSALGYVWQASLHGMGLLTKHVIAGEWDDAVAEIEDTLSLAARGEATFGVQIFPHALLAVILVHRGDLEGATAALASGEQLSATGGSSYDLDTTRWARSLLLEAQGDVDGAASAARGAWSFYQSHGFFQDFYTHRWVGPDVVRLALAVGDEPFARSVTTDLEKLAAAANDVSSAEGAALRCRGVIDNDVDILLRAVQAYEQSGHRFGRALVAEEVGSALIRLGSLDAAVNFFEDAISVYSHVGAVRDIARAEAILRSAGIRRSKKAASRKATVGWESLTQTERSVVALLAEGLYYREVADRLFISRRTVETHVSHVFQKLGITSRRELERMLAARKQPGGQA